ncbi:restriction endonuclease subunit S [Paenibacillus sp. FSL M7-0896]|uniref:restriction endonuclease subunit S n=1 Tax=Paenibacillus sp. FSL M7-0896 TaxID=2921610 RepID=UPI0030D89208
MNKLIEIIEKPLPGEWGVDDEVGSGIPVLRTTNFTNNGTINYSNVVTRIIDTKKAENKFLSHGDIIIEKSGGSPQQPVGRVVFFEGENNKYLFNNFTSVIRLKDKEINYPKYMFYYLFFNYRMGGTRKFQNKTTGISNLKLDRFIKETEIPLPPIETQKQIAETLNVVAELLVIRKQQFTEMDNLIKSAFCEMFGNENEFDKWECTTIGNVAKVTVGVVIKPAQYYTQESNGVKTFRSLNVGEMYVRDKSWIYFTPEGHKIHSKSILIAGDVLVVRSGYPGTSCVVTEEYVGCNAVDIIIARPDVIKINPLYLCAFTNFPHGKNQIFKGTSGAAQQHFNVGAYKAMTIPLPPLKLQNQFANIVNKIEEQKAIVKQAIDETQQLFDSLMSQYFE